MKQPITHYLYLLTFVDSTGETFESHTYLKEGPYFGEDFERFVQLYSEWYELKGFFSVKFERWYSSVPV